MPLRTAAPCLPVCVTRPRNPSLPASTAGRLRFLPVPRFFHVLTSTCVVNGARYGGELVTVYGLNFGPPGNDSEYFERVAYGPAARYTASNCTVVDHDQLQCLTVRDCLL
jgi:hypothetical protein